MRTSEEILSSVFGYYFDNETNKDMAFRLHKKAINEARKEAIEECAEKAILHYAGNGYPIITVDKESILSLINELK